METRNQENELGEYHYNNNKEEEEEEEEVNHVPYRIHSPLN
jgi:hypothetical protein